MVASKTRALCNEWALFSASLSPDHLSRALNRIALNFWRLPQEVDLRRDHCLKGFLEKHVIRTIFPKVKLNNEGQLGIEALLQPLQQRALLLGKSGALRPKDASLVLNAYAKIYQTVNQSHAMSSHQWKGVPRLLRHYATEIIPTARSLVSDMNEQDLSLVLNCMSKMGIQADELLKVASRELVRHLRGHFGQETYGHKASHVLPKAKYNLFSQLTPQGASLIVNSFAKSNVALDESVIGHILHRFLPENLERFLPQQLAMLLHGFMKFNVPKRDVHTSLCHLDQLVASEFAGTNAKLLSASMYTFGKYNFLPLALARKLDGITQSKPMRCSELEISNIYYGLGRLNLRCERFLAKLGQSLSAILHDLSPQGLSTACYALARLEVDDALYSTVLRQFDKIVKRSKDSINCNRISNSLATANNQVLPLHLVNVCFSATTAMIVDQNIFASMLDHLYLCFRKYQGTSEGGIRGSSDGHADASSGLGSLPADGNAMVADRRTCDFINTELGTQGIYQLYCICQHIAVFAHGGLRAQNLNVLQLLEHLFDTWDKISRDRHVTGILDYTDGSVSLVDPDITTSRIQTAVFDLLKTMIPACGVAEHAPSSDTAVNGTQQKHTMIVAESQATPYVIDILLYSV
ncbi:uncharacterized protein BXIN_0125 [Babesia sp. Xinjiang]|uniref:uncharacterized protein n=1 Tax=Babesia sp. Xinjiang TaxID=462227 RepID=UPI000A245117|nr:uncharacterized protein BXIN_0125 [Babesia sp. Xinjiang]ORM39742.1 hypothetical protein BXIN_0125 [Babesia sp. Xinjiang]